MTATVAVFFIIALIATFFTDIISLRKGPTFWRIMFLVVSTTLLVIWFYMAR